MPIKGLTDQGSSSFPEIGKLRKGDVKKGNAPGKDLDHFRFDSKDSKAIADFQAAYGDRPREINVLLPYDDVEQCFSTCKEEWVAGGLQHRCDGEFVSALRVGQLVQRHFTAPVPCPGGCKEVGRLRVIIPELKRLAYITAETHGKWDVLFLHSQLSECLVRFGRLRDIPFVLRRVLKEVSTPNGNGRARREKWMLNIEVDPYWTEQRLDAIRQRSLQYARMETFQALPPAEEFPVAESVRSLPSAKPEPTNEYVNSQEWKTFKEFMLAAEQDEDPRGKMDKLEDWVFRQVRPGKLPQHALGAIERELKNARDRIEARGNRPLPRIPEQEAIAVEAVTAEVDF